MLLQDENAGPMEWQGASIGADTVREAWQIEKLLNRAHEIHRSHGGLFGYDLGDWLQAERELAERTRAVEITQDRFLQDRSHDSAIYTNGRSRCR
jgi:hypothetical protein